MITSFQRRSILRALGIAGGSFVLPSLMPRTAKAATVPEAIPLVLEHSWHAGAVLVTEGGNRK